MYKNVIWNLANDFDLALEFDLRPYYHLEDDIFNTQFDDENLGGIICGEIKDFDSNEFCSNPFEGMNMYYNKNKKAFTIKEGDRVTVVKKCKEDKEDIEKAMLYAYMKHIGISPSVINNQLGKVKIIEKKEKKNEKV